MPTVCINTPGSKVRLTSERLEIHGPGEDGQVTILRSVGLREIDRFIAREGVQITSEALSAMLRAEIPVALLGWDGRCLGAFHPTATAHGLTRLRHYQIVQDPPFCLAMTGRIITAKLYNQRRVLQRMAANRAQDIRPALDSLSSLFSDSSRAQNIDELRGFEGAAAACYFTQWATFLPPSFPFERRSRRPPLNPVNACISFGSTLLYQEMVSFIHAHGLDPALGMLHATEDGRWSLALDLIEPFRPVLVEALALDLFTHQMLDRTHFEPRNGGIYLNTEGRARFIVQYERRMEREFMSECVGHRTTLRRQVDAQVVMFKGALTEPAKFEPFLIN